MYTNYHLTRAQEITTGILENIRETFKSKPIKLTVEIEEDETAFLLSNVTNKAMLLKSIKEGKNG